MNTGRIEHFISHIKVSHLFYAALTLRLLALAVMPHLHFKDVVKYQIAGDALFSGGDFSNYVMPLYPIIYHLTGGGIGVKLLDCFLSAFTVIILYKISLQLFHQKSVAILTALAAAIYPFFIFYSISGLTETSFLFLLCLSFYLFYEKKYFMACTVSALALLIRPTNNILNPFLVLTFILLVHQENWKTALKWLSCYLVIFLILVSPWWVFNYHRYHQFVPFDLASGVVLYSGNNPMNHSGGGIGGVDVDASRFNKIKDPVKRNIALTQAAKQYAFSHPLHILKLSGVKFLRFWRLYPYTPRFKNTFTIITSLFSFGIVLALCLVYLFRHFKRDWRRIMPMLLLAFYLTIGSMITIASMRYRLPIEPFMLIFGAYTLDEFIRWLDRRHTIPLTQNI